MADPPRMTEAEAAEFRRRQKGRNIAMLVVLIAPQRVVFRHYHREDGSHD